MMTDPHLINDLVNRALLLYGELALRPKANWFDRDLIDELNASRDLDPTGLTTFMLLRGQTDSFLDTKTFSARKVLLHYDEFRRETARIYELLQTVEDPAVVELIETFQAELRQMADRYAYADRDAFEKAITDKGWLAYVRRNALRSMQTLDVHQFVQGKGSPEPLQVSGSVYEFWNVNSVLAAMRGQGYPGVTLCLIRDPAQVMASYFLFAVRNGDNITVLTDIEEGPHPLYYQMSRRPGRTLDERAQRHHFPYELLELEPVLGSGGNVKDLRAKTRTQLVRINTEAVPMKKLGELDPDQFVWAGLVMHLLAEKYGGADPALLPEVSYTGQMVVEPHALVGAESGLVAAGQYAPLQLPVLTRADVTAETTAEQWDGETVGHNEWMVARYGERVPDAVLNPVGIEAARQLTGQMQKGGGLTRVHDAGMWGEQEVKESLEALSPTTFGTPAKLQRDRLWAARTNQCRVIQAAAEAEYKRDKGKVRAWLIAQTQARRDFIIDACARGELVLPDVPFEGKPTTFGFDRDEVAKSGEARDRNMLRQWHDRGFADLVDHSKRPTLGTLDNSRRPYWFCPVTGGPAALFSQVEPTCPEALAALFGCTVDELPFGLQHYYVSEPYSGNPILRRLDPSDWVLDNPWNRLRVKVYVALSKTAVNDRRRAQGLTPYGAADWERLTPESVKEKRKRRR